MNMLQRDKLMKEKRELEAFNKMSLLDQQMDAGGDGVIREDVDEGAKNKKKEEMKEHQKIIQQFDKLATAFERTSGAGSTVKTTSKGGKKEVPETAGMLKKKGKKRKEKSLSAKLRLKEKKGGGSGKWLISIFLVKLTI